MYPAVRIRVLDDVIVERDGAGVTVGGAKLRALLTVLALAAPRPVSDERLIEELWGDTDLTNPANALQAQVAQLRKLVGRDVVRREPSGYALAIDGPEVDAQQLELHVADGGRAAAEGDHQRAATAFRAALSLAPGRPFDGMLDHPFAREAASRLEQRLIEAHSGLIEAELAAGRHGEVVAPLTALVAQHPLWEGFHRQLMLALYRCGRQSDALRAYTHARNVLSDEVGLDPGPELQALERAILAHDPALAAPVPLHSIGHLAVLPAPLTSFIGRVGALAALDAARSTARLVSVVGVGGVGKTRLAIEAVRRLSRAREVWFVELAAVREPQLVAMSFAAAIGAGDHAPAGATDPNGRSLARSIERIANRPVTVVLDNCEHVLDAAAALVSRLLAACPQLSVIATSREPLGIDGEQQVVLGPLDSDEAASLFTSRASAVQPHLARDDAANRDIVDLCRKLDGLPLAIELAAARTKTLPVPEIAERLADRFGLLVDTRRGTGRHDGLRSAIDWSYDLLFEEERRAFRRLATFAGGLTIDAAEAQCGPDALDLLSRLVDKSLLVADTGGRAARFHMLETLRAYAVERLAETGELQDALAAHADWCLRLAEQAAGGIRGRDQLGWLDRLDREHENIAAALAHVTSADPAVAVRMVGALILPWWFRGRGREARRWAEACLASAGQDDADPRAYATLLLWSGLLADFGDEDELPADAGQELALAESRQRLALAIASAEGDDALAAAAATQLALVLTRRAIAGETVDGAERARLIEDVVATFTRLQDPFALGLIHALAAVAAFAAGDVDGAAAAAERAERQAALSGDRFTAGRVQWVRGVLAESHGDVDRAYLHIERGLRLLDELGMGREVTAQAVVLADLADRRAKPELAERWRAFVEGRAGGLARHDALLRASAQHAEAQRADDAGDPARAEAAHLAAAASYRRAGAKAALAHTHLALADLARRRGDRDRAGTELGLALAEATSAADPVLVAAVLTAAAIAAAGLDHRRAATLLGVARRADPDGVDADASVGALITELRGSLGAGTFEEHLAAGRAIDPTALERLGALVSDP